MLGSALNRKLLYVWGTENWRGVNVWSNNGRQYHTLSNVSAVKAIVHWAFHSDCGVFQWTDRPCGTAALCVRPGGQICYLTPNEGDWAWPYHVKPCLPVSMQRTHNYSLKLTGHARPISEGHCFQLLVQTQRGVAHATLYWHHSAEGHDRMVSSRARRTVAIFQFFKEVDVVN